MPQGNPGWLMVGTEACESSDCCAGDLKASAPSLLGVTGEKADGRGKAMASMPSLFSLSVAGFDFVTLSLLTIISHPMSACSVSPLFLVLSSSATCFSVLLFRVVGWGLGQSLGLTGTPFATTLNCLAVCPFFCDTREMEFLHRLYFMWLKR